MDKRQKKIFESIVEQYIKTAQPVGSEYLAEKFDLKISPATIRNEMVELTRHDYLSQPHTSAGRIPTVKGFQYYVENLLLKKHLLSSEKQILKSVKQKTDSEILMKGMTKQIAVLSGELSILAFDDHNFYYTGLSYLFSQPEFEHQEIVYNISQIVDHLDKIMGEIFDSIGNETEILIGEKNPFSNFCSAILARCRLPSRRHYNLIGILGPVRMDYNKNIALIDYVKDLLSA